MQTFLPYPNFRDSLESLDSKRLGKQRVESFQILKTLLGYSDGWKHHPVVKMWRHYEAALAQYYNLSLVIWAARGYKNIVLQPATITGTIVYPPFIGDEQFHASHRSRLLRKDPEFYGKYQW